MMRPHMPKCMTSDKRRDKQAYWEARLTRMGLSVEAGRHDWLTFGHTPTDLNLDGGRTYKPTDGELEETQEWPISL